jgi:TatD DNase family protein
MLLIDTHAHMGDQVFDNDREDVLKRARDAGLAAVVTVGEDISDAERNLKLWRIHPMLLPAAGLYPSNAEINHAESVVDFIRRERDKLWAIGEVGLDYWIAKDERERGRQRDIFLKFIDLSIELDLPLNVHSRSAGRHVVDMLVGRGAKKVQLHAFDGKASSALPAVKAGFFFSIPPSVVRSPQKQKLVRALPLSCLLIETDSPVLGPSIEKRNEPANALVSVDAIAKLKNVNREDVLEVVSQNTQKLYVKMRNLSLLG